MYLVGYVLIHGSVGRVIETFPQGLRRFLKCMLKSCTGVLWLHLWFSSESADAWNLTRVQGSPTCHCISGRTVISRSEVLDLCQDMFPFYWTEFSPAMFHDNKESVLGVECVSVL